MIATILLVISILAILGGGGSALYQRGLAAGKTKAIRSPTVAPPALGPSPDLPTRNERWVMETEHEIHPNKPSSFFTHKNCRACGPGPLNKLQIPSAYDHVYYENVTYSSGYGGSITKPIVSPIADAEIVSSEIEGYPGYHTVILDIDLPARLVESSTPGHFHLYIDKPMLWDDYKDAIRALASAGIVEPEFYKASLKNKATHLRLPWIEK